MHTLYKYLYQGLVQWQKVNKKWEDINADGCATLALCERAWNSEHTEKTAVSEGMLVILNSNKLA